MQKTKRFLLPLAIILAMAFVMTSVIALPVFQEPVAGSNWSTAVNTYMNITVVVESNIVNNMTNVTCFYNVSGGHADVLLTTMTNTTPDQTTFSSTTVTIPSTDGMNYNISCEVGNLSSLNFTVSSSNVGIDSTAPSCTVTTDYSSVNLGRYFKYTTSYADATTGLKISYCNITDAEGEIDKDGPLSTTNSTEFQDTHVAGTYNITCVTVDEVGNSKNCSAVVTAKTTGRPIVRVEEGKSLIQGLDKKTIIVAIVVILLIAMALSGKKK